MSSSISIKLLICLLVFLPSCCRGFKDPCQTQDRHILKLCEQVSATKYKNWYRNLKIYEIEEEIQKNIERIQQSRLIEDTIIKEISEHLDIGSRPIRGQLIDSQPSKDGNPGYRNAELIIAASRSIKSTHCIIHGISDRQCAKDLSNVKLSKTSLGEMCFSEYYNLTECTGRNLTFRSADGSCNNLKRSYLGKATTAYKRLLFPAYTDGVKDISELLPNPRRISVGLVNDEQSPDDIKSMAMAYWGIFIGHDLSRTAVSTMGTNNTFVRCCDNNGMMHYTLNKYVRSCNPITIPDDDAFYEPKLQSCMNYVRSVPAMRPDCTFGPMEQMNQATHYLDGSMIYGSSVEQTMALRTMSGGLLKMDKFEVKEVISPEETNLYQAPPVHKWYYMPLESEACQYGNGTCYKAGDTRANSLPQLTVLYTLWARQHNRFARELSWNNEHWDDERIFQEARKFVVASIQHITYTEWLPALLGENYTRQNGLEMVNDWFHDTYDETADPVVSNSFATAILPFANSMLSDNISLYSENRLINGSFSLKEHYNRPMYSVRNYTDELIRGLTTQNAQKVDMLFTQTITNYLYTTHPDNLFGMDFISLAIQRSRDHGIPSYIKFRKYCGLKEIENIQDLSQIMVEGSADKLMKQYKSWSNIDLLIGVLLEKHAEGAMVGPTMRCIIRDQFVRTRAGDRYFYDLPNVFSAIQLEQIKNLKLATFLCINSNNMTTMQEQAFLIPSSTNELKNCSSFPEIAVSRWLEQRPHTER